uniref:VP2 n=1 Tax=Raja clavata polyomavirus 1 TaxID=3072331 RepID=A0AA51RER7_9POLY|nr:VP2 [Raja clavata polyomavirus 1]
MGAALAVLGLEGVLAATVASEEAAVLTMEALATSAAMEGFDTVPEMFAASGIGWGGPTGVAVANNTVESLFGVSRLGLGLVNLGAGINSAAFLASQPSALNVNDQTVFPAYMLYKDVPGNPFYSPRYSPYVPRTGRWGAKRRFPARPPRKGQQKRRITLQPQLRELLEEAIEDEEAPRQLTEDEADEQVRLLLEYLEGRQELHAATRRRVKGRRAKGAAVAALAGGLGLYVSSSRSSRKPTPACLRSKNGKCKKTKGAGKRNAPKRRR